MREFKFFRGYITPTLTDRLEQLLQDYEPVTLPDLREWGQPFRQYNPIWTVNPGLIQYTPPNYVITTTPGTGTYTIPNSGTINTATSISLTTSNPNGTTYTTTGMGGILTTSANTFYNQTIK
jgi:hypothetical protein